LENEREDSEIDASGGQDGDDIAQTPGLAQETAERRWGPEIFRHNPFGSYTGRIVPGQTRDCISFQALAEWQSQTASSSSFKMHQWRLAIPMLA
jgi:hypothetical protein